MNWSLLLNKYAVGVAVAIFLLAGFWIAGDVHGHRVQRDGDSAAFTAMQKRADDAESANATNALTIASLKAANQKYADAASLAQAQEQRAEAELTEQVQANAKALSAAQKQLQEAIHANPDAARWGATRVPAGVLQQLAGPD